VGVRTAFTKQSGVAHSHAARGALARDHDFGGSETGRLCNPLDNRVLTILTKFDLSAVLVPLLIHEEPPPPTISPES
jgi:hypothetical protein